MNLQRNETNKNLFHIATKIQQSTSTISEIRVPIFMPLKKIAHNSNIALEFKKNNNILELVTSWGKVQLRGRKLLTSVHRDILDCIMTYNDKTEDCPNGDIDLYFSLTKILRHYGIDNPNANISWLKKRIEEIRDMTINYERTNGDSFDFNLIQNLIFSEEYKMYKITLSKAYVQFYASELSINYKKELPNILKIDDSVIKHIIRWFFTHKSGQYFELDTVLDAIGIPSKFLSTRMKQLHKKSIRENVITFNRFGIDYDPLKEKFHYAGNENVSFIAAILVKKDKALNKKDKQKEILSQYKGIKITFNESELTIDSILMESNDKKKPINYLISVSELDESLQFANKSELDEKEFEKSLVNYLETSKVS